MDQTGRLVRSRTDRLISGVCGGIAQYFKFDSVIVRGIFVVVALINPGIAAIAYLVAVFLISEESEMGSANEPHVGWRFDPWTGDPIHQHPATPETMIVPSAEESSAESSDGEPALAEPTKTRRTRKKSAESSEEHAE